MNKVEESSLVIRIRKSNMSKTSKSTQVRLFPTKKLPPMLYNLARVSKFCKCFERSSAKNFFNSAAFFLYLLENKLE